MTVSLGLAWTALGLLFGGWPKPDLALLFPVLGPCFGSMLGVAWRQRRRPVWVRISDAGIELAQGGAPVFVGWANVASVSVHRWGVFAVLDVVPIALHEVTTTAPCGPVPRVRQLPGGMGFRVEVGELFPRPARLLRELSRYQRALP
ncbi:hypothetical protein COUCH_04565 [Couchioplanes caeruleus]|uniref:hypothetical protein n=1 Tax=Couchioplanes caeruleus TaxID=56438 RepID=UPI0020BFF5EC|nr:hypothetical protein [Couchioplanes caeruleus]UQU65603.1 hypothetical protein COUCH_04565 [Couchioplanes caeruleus]